MPKKACKYLVFYIGLVCFLRVSGQNPVLNEQFTLKLFNTDSVKVFKYLKYKDKYKTKKELIKSVNIILDDLRFQGYLLADIDKVKGDSLNKIYYLRIGKKFKWAILKKGNADMDILSHLGYSEKLYTNKPFSYSQTARLIDKTITAYENNGYPFVSLKLDSISVNDNTLSAVLNITKNKLIQIDSIVVKGDAKINKTFLYRYLGLKPMMLYDEASFMAISKKIKQLPFLTETKGQEIRLTEKQNKMYLFLGKKNCSQFDGIIGILPDDKTKKTIFTGDVKIKLVNSIFRAGETVDLNWRRLQALTQDFNARVIYPYILGSPIGVDYNLKIYKKDSSFIDVNNNVGLQYYFSGLNNLKVFYKQRTADLLSTSGLAFITTLPDYADISTSSYGLGLTFEKLDYRFNPHKGFAINISGQTGNKTIKKNSKINDIVYNNLQLKSTQYQSEGNVNLFLQIKGNSVIRMAAQYATVFGTAPVFKNELFRIGGLRTLRGFDEESIYASSYVIPTLEYRFLFGQNSNILLFAEGAWYENNSSTIYLKDMPYSIGAGINFDTKAGIFSLNYALGSQKGNAIDVRSGKIHFGLTALF
ncbi:MAG TPA: BamA/TamA family outer membrane protein [Bacteroidia bacterium]|jgi:outer membrane protein assembly factor BamA|nr:BamA/TamA family outer membrane protein [Bacteroidia bacterium]